MLLKNKIIVAVEAAALLELHVVLNSERGHQGGRSALLEKLLLRCGFNAAKTHIVDCLGPLVVPVLER